MFRCLGAKSILYIHWISHRRRGGWGHDDSSGSTSTFLIANLCVNTVSHTKESRGIEIWPVQVAVVGEKGNVAHLWTVKSQLGR